MFHLALNEYLFNFIKNLYLTLLISLNLVLIIFMSSMFISEYRKLSPFNVLKGLEGRYIQLLTSYDIDSIKDLISAEANYYQFYHYTGHSNDNNFNEYTFDLTGEDNIVYEPFVYLGESFRKSEAPEGMVPIICSDNVENIQIGTIINIDGVECYVSGLFNFSSATPGNDSSFTEGDDSYTSLYNNVSLKNDEDYYTYAYNTYVYVIGDYDLLSRAGIVFEEVSKFFITYDVSGEEIINADINAIDSYCMEESGINGVLSEVTLDEFFYQSNKQIFKNVGKLIPLLIGSILIMFSSMLCICFVNAQENESKIAIMRLTGCRLRHIFRINLLKTLYILIMSILLSYIFVSFLRFKYVSKEFLSLGFFQLICCAMFCIIVLAVCSLIPVKAARDKSITELIKHKEWS